jgi:hypothetical protein
MFYGQIQKVSEQHLFRCCKMAYRRYLQANRIVGVVFGVVTGLIFLTSLYPLSAARNRYLPVAFLSVASLSYAICYGLSWKPSTQDQLIAQVRHLLY